MGYGCTMSKALGLIREASQHSTMKRWMIKHRDRMATELAATGRPSWQRIAEILDAEGLTDADGNPPSRNTARLTWRSIVKHVPVKPIGALPRPSSPPPAAPPPAELPEATTSGDDAAKARLARLAARTNQRSIR